MTVDDTLNMIQIDDVQLSPDGSRVMYSLSRLDWDQNKRLKSLYIMPADSGAAIKMNVLDKSRDYRFTPEGTHISYLAPDSTGYNQLFVIPVDGTFTLQLSYHKSGISSYTWTPDGLSILFLADEYDEDEAARMKKGDDAVYIDEGPNGQFRQQWNNLWLLDVATQRERRITDEDMRIDKRQLNSNLIPEGRLLWAPDGKKFVFTMVDDQKWEWGAEKLYVMDAATRDYHLLSGNFEGNIRYTTWTSDSKSILFSGEYKTSSNLFRLDAETGAISALTNQRGSIRVHGISRDGGRMVYTYSDFSTPPDLYSSLTLEYAPVRLTDVNPWIRNEIELAQGSVVKWKSRYDWEIEGILHLPAGYRDGERLPLIVHVHGGPSGHFANSFSARNQIWAELGYVQLSPNYRGSGGYGDKFQRGNMFDIGGGEFEDLMTGVDYVIESGYADPGQLGIRGWSWGGVLGGWTITQTNRFKAASLGAMVCDWTTEYANGFGYNIVRWFIGGYYWNNPDGWRTRSSLTHIKNVTTPAIFFHGANDRTCSPPQSMNYASALKDRGVPCRLIMFPREGHGIREPHHQRIRDIEEIRWMQKYIRGIEWNPRERK